MRITRFIVENFRNLAHVDLELCSGTVIVGENRAGKSNLLHALRLILDGRLSYADRQLGAEDFHDGLSNGEPDWDPMAEGHVIQASIEVEDFMGNAGLIAALSDALVAEDPPRARLTYRFAPVDGTGDDRPRYKGAVYGGAGDGQPISSEKLASLHLVFLHALRDVEADIRNLAKVSTAKPARDGRRGGGGERRLGRRQSRHEGGQRQAQRPRRHQGARREHRRTPGRHGRAGPSRRDQARGRPG